MLASLVGQPAVVAQPAAGQGPGNHLRILEIHADPDAGTIQILGEGFNFGPGPLTVSLGTLGDITPSCTLTNPQTIDCNLGRAFPSAGDYLLTVATGMGQSQGDEYDLTIGAAAGCPCFNERDVAAFVVPLSCTSGITTSLQEDRGCGFASVSSGKAGNTCAFNPSSAPKQCEPVKVVLTPITPGQAASCKAILDAEIGSRGLRCFSPL